MDWELILKTYSDDREGILIAKDLNENVYAACRDYRLPAVSTSRLASGDFQELVPVLSDISISVWKSRFNTSPSFDMTSAADAFIWGGSINVPEKDSQTIGTLLNNALRAILRKIRETSPGPEQPAAHDGKCAFCGSHARIAFDEESQRILHCTLCGHSWRFPRLRCTFCGNADHETLGFFEAEGIEGVRIYFCRACNHFIKSFDTRDRILSDPDTMDALTLELDELAKEEGFVSMS